MGKMENGKSEDEEPFMDSALSYHVDSRWNHAAQFDKTLEFYVSIKNHSQKLHTKYKLNR